MKGKIKNIGEIGVGKVKDSQDNFVRSWREKGATVIEVNINGKKVGFMAIADTLKDSARLAMEQLKKEGFEVAMITGDDEKTAIAIGRQLGIERIMANVLPQEKAGEIEKLKDQKNQKNQKGKVAFVGDGINDAPALSLADLGIAMGGGTDVAREAGDIILVKDTPSDVLRAIKLAQATFNKVKFNFFWAFFYNILGVPIAAGALSSLGVTLRPEFAGLAMAFSSISVVANSLLLKRKDWD